MPRLRTLSPYGDAADRHSMIDFRAQTFCMPFRTIARCLRGIDFMFLSTNGSIGYAKAGVKVAHW